MDAMTELAKLFKERNNPSIQGISVGTILAPLPDLKVKVNGFIFDKSNIIVAKHLVETYKSDLVMVGNHGDHFHKVEDLLKTGDRVIVMPSTSNGFYYILDKVGDI